MFNQVFLCKRLTRNSKCGTYYDCWYKAGYTFTERHSWQFLTPGCYQGNNKICTGKKICTVVKYAFTIALYFFVFESGLILIMGQSFPRITIASTPLSESHRRLYTIAGPKPYDVKRQRRISYCTTRHIHVASPVFTSYLF